MSQNEVVSWNHRLEKLSASWLNQALVSKTLHYASHQRYIRLHYALGIPVVVVTATIGTAIFASLGNASDNRLQIFSGSISIVAAVLAALQTFLRCSERSEQHRMAAARYGIIAREIEYTLALSCSQRGDPSTIVERWRANFESLAEQSPTIPHTHQLSNISVPESPVLATSSAQNSLHLATHGYFSREDISNVESSMTDLVVLSACETGLGTIVPTNPSPQSTWLQKSSNSKKQQTSTFKSPFQSRKRRKHTRRKPPFQG